MNCPRCVDQVLDVTRKAGIEVDVCPRCRGLWLDRGEIDRLLTDVSRAEASIAPTEFRPQPSPFGPDGTGLANDGVDDRDRDKKRDRDRDRDRDKDKKKDTDKKKERDRDRDRDENRDWDRDRKKKKKKKKKKSLTYMLGEALEDIFD